MTPDAQFRESVRRDALAAGLPRDIADYLAREVGRQPTDDEIAAMPSRVRAFLAVEMSGSRTRQHQDALSKIADLYGASALVPELRRSGLPLRSVADILATATGSRHAIDRAGIDQARMQMLAAVTYRND